jgi:hypothetical protein
MWQKFSHTAVLLLVLWGYGTSIEAAVITFAGSGTGAGGASLQAQADFDITGSTLTVTLANIATNDNNSSGNDTVSNTLSGVFFTLTGNPTLTPVSATIPTGSSLVQANTCTPGPCSSSTTNVGGEFRYEKSAYASPRGNQGIGSASYMPNRFLGGNLGGPTSTIHLA